MRMLQMPHRSVREVARLLGNPPSRLAKAFWDGHVEAPVKGPGGTYLWNDRDIDPASMAPEERLAEVVAILAAGVLRLRSRAAVSVAVNPAEDSPESARNGLEDCAGKRLSGQRG